MQNNPQNNPSDDDSNHQRQPATQNIAGGVRTKSAIRAAISFGLLAAVCGVVAGHLVSFHRFFANLSLLFLWAFFIFVSISFTIDFKRNQGKRRVAHWGGGSIIVIGSALCLYLRAWNRHPPTDLSEKTEQSVRVKFSSRQTIESKLGDPKQILNLDNVATLQLWSCGADVVEFLLTQTGSLSTPRPQGKEYNIGGGDKIGFPQTGPNFRVSNAMVVRGPAKVVKFTPDQRDNYVKIVDIDRSFRIHLDQINGSPSEGVDHQYVFSITEK